jgi:hypothetical protein
MFSAFDFFPFLCLGLIAFWIVSCGAFIVIAIHELRQKRGGAT